MVTASRSGIKDASMGESPLMVNSVLKAFRVLTAFSSAEPRLTLTRLGEKLGIDKSTAQRFTHTLLTMGYLDKDAATKTFGVTVRVLDLAHIYLDTNPLIAATLPYLVHLNAETGETVNLAVLDGTDVVFVSRIVGRHLLSTGVIIGTRLPAYITATGLAMLSFMPPDQADQILASSELKAHTPHTVFDPKMITERLRISREKGYALSVGDCFPDDISIGAPIVSSSGQLLGALAVAVTSQRFTPEEVETQFSKLVCAAARSVRV